MKSNRKNLLLAVTISLAGFAFTAPSAFAVDFTWDGADTVTSGAQGGTGTWDSNTTANWWDGSADVVWPNSGTDNDAIFGGTAGTVSVSSVTANDLTFNANGYILSGASTLTLNGTTPTITTNAGSPATIGNATDTVLAGSAGLFKAGTNTLTLDGSAVNTFTGGLNLKGGTLALSLNNLATPTNLIDSGNALSIGGSTLAVTAKATGNTVQTFAGTNAASGNSAISLNRSTGTTATLNLGTLTHSNGAIVGFTTTPSMSNVASTSVMIKVSNAASTLNGGLAAWAFVGNSTTNGGRWVAVDASGTLKIVTASTVIGTNWSTVTDASTIYTTSTAATLGANATAQGLQNAATGNIAVALGTNKLTANGLLSINSGVTWSFTSSGAGGITIGAEKDLILAGGGNFSLAAPVSNNGGGSSGLTLAGGGTATLTGVNAYTGQTTVNSGKMVISTGGSINTSNGITVSGGTFVHANTTTSITPAVSLQGGTVDGTGTINTVNVADLATTRITNGNATTTALTVGNLTFSGDAGIDIRTAGSAGLAVTVTLTTTPANGKVTVNVTAAPVWSIGSTYNLISYGTLAGSLADFTKGTIAGLGGRQTADLVTNGNTIALTIGGDKALWTGAASGNWTTSAIASPFNWKTLAGGADTDFLASDDVVFDDTAISTAVTIADATVSPSSTTFNNSTKSYTISGGGIATGNLTKNGTNSISLTTSNTYTGATTINGGSLQISGGAAIANTGLVTLANTAGAAFQVAGSETIGALSGGGATGGNVSIDASQTLTLSSGTQTFAGAVSGAGALTGSGAVQTLSGILSHGGGLNATSGALTLSNGSNSYTGITTLSANVTAGAGILVTANGALGAIGAGNETTISGVPVSPAITTSQLGFSGSINYSMAEKITGSGIGGAANVGPFIATQRGFIQSVSGNNTFAGDIELSANGVSRIGTQDGASLTLTGAITQAAGVTTASILFRAGSIAGDFVTLSNTGNSFGGNSTVFTGLNTSGSYAGVRLGASNALPTNLTISGFGGTSTATAASAAFDLNGFNQTLNGLISGNGANSVMSIINTNTGTPSTLTLNPTADRSSGATSTVNTLVVGGGGLGVINLVKEGAFTQTLTGINTYTGTTTITAGSLIINEGSIATSSNIVNNAALEYKLTTNARNYANVISGTGSLTKSGTNSLTLSGINTYSGNTTVSGGTLTISNAASSLNANTGNDASTVTIAATGATLDLTYTGTDTVDKLFIGATQLAAGVYGPTATSIPQITNSTGSGTLTVLTGPGGFSSWITGTFANGTVPGGQQGPNDDFDKDGISNLVEYAIAGQDPTVGNPTVGTFNGTDLSFTKRADANGLTYAIQDSTDLGLTDAWAEVSGGSYVNNATTISYTLTPGTLAKNFLRLQVLSN